LFGADASVKLLALRRGEFLESLRPRGMRLGSRMTAAATTGPARRSGTASSHPPPERSPAFAARFARKLGRKGRLGSRQTGHTQRCFANGRGICGAGIYFGLSAILASRAESKAGTIPVQELERISRILTPGASTSDEQAPPIRAVWAQGQCATGVCSGQLRFRCTGPNRARRRCRRGVVLRR